MSQTLRIYEDINGKKLTVTAYCGENGDKSVQLTIDENSCLIPYVNLTGIQCLDLIEVLKRRLDGKWTATGDEAYPPKIVGTDGMVIGFEE